MLKLTIFCLLSAVFCNKTQNVVPVIYHFVTYNETHVQSGSSDHTTAKCRDVIATTEKETPTTPRRPPPSGYDLVPGLGYYKLHADVKPWQEALESCEEEGTHLLVINSQEEANALNYMWQKYPDFTGAQTNNWAWIGFNDIAKEGDYVTVQNTSLYSTGYVKWGPTEPNGIGQNCGLVGRNLFLADFPCQYKQPYFCEQEL